MPAPPRTEMVQCKLQILPFNKSLVNWQPANGTRYVAIRFEADPNAAISLTINNTIVVVSKNFEEFSVPAGAEFGADQTWTVVPSGAGTFFVSIMMIQE